MDTVAAFSGTSLLVVEGVDELPNFRRRCNTQILLLKVFEAKRVKVCHYVDGWGSELWGRLFRYERKGLLLASRGWRILYNEGENVKKSFRHYLRIVGVWVLFAWLMPRDFK